MDNPSSLQNTTPHDETDKHPHKSDVSRYEIVEDDQKPDKFTVVEGLPVDGEGNDLYAEALARYPNDECIDSRDENKVRRKLEFRILPVLGICYFFYYVDKTTLLVQSRIVHIETMLTIFADRTPPSSASETILPSKAKSIHGCQAVSTLVGSSGQFHPTS